MVEKNNLLFKKKENTRIIIYNGVILGSGGFKEYDNNTAIINYMYIDFRNKYILNHLYKELEKDILKLKYKNIIIISDLEVVDFYKKLGYVENNSYDFEKIFNILGARIIEPIVLSKSF